MIAIIAPLRRGGIGIDSDGDDMAAGAGVLARRCTGGELGGCDSGGCDAGGREIGL